MPKPDNQFEELARDAAERIDASREMAEQLSLLPDEQPGAALVAEGGRRGRGPGKAANQMREWLAARGYRLPEDVLAEMAGLASREDAILTAMAQAERVLAWAADGAAAVKGAPSGPTLRMRLDAFMQLYTIMLRSADALMPYGAPKATPDVAVTNVNQIVVQGAAAASAPAERAGDRARDVTPQARRIGPPPMPHQMQQNQGVSGSAGDGSDGEFRTDEASV